MTSQSESERNQFTSLGQTWYVFTNQLSGTQPLYRLVAGSDHMDSIFAGEGGYSTEETLGNGFTSSGAAGAAFMQRSYDSSNNDHDTQVPGHVLPGYSAEPLGIYGYPRYGTQSTSLTTITANNVTATVNAVAGGAFWSWTWNANQFLNTDDNGREMQSAFYYGYNPSNQQWAQNPTEAGDWVGGNAQDRHGSPVVSTSVSGTVISTRTVPLDWNSPPPDPQVNSDRATIYKDVIIGKNVDLNFYNMPGVASYTTVLTLPNAVSGASLEMPTAYLNTTYDHFWAYDAKLQQETNATPSPCGHVEVNSGQYLPSGYGGVIIGKGDKSAALGVYARLDTVGGPASYFTLWKLDDGTPSCNYHTNKWSVVRGDPTQPSPSTNFPSGTSSYQTFVLTGTVDSIESNMRQLYSQGY